MVTFGAASVAYQAHPPVAYTTEHGKMLRGTIEDCLESEALAHIRGEVQLLLTSPPFPLNKKKKYGNLTGDAYVTSLAALAPGFSDLLAPGGSIVMEIGNAWEPGRPTMSTLSLRALLAFLEAGGVAFVPTVHLVQSSENTKSCSMGNNREDSCQGFVHKRLVDV